MPFANPHPLYSVWMSMKNRCRHQSNPQWKDYGGRGITVCDRWQVSFDAWLADMGPRPEGYVLDRIDNDKGYYPENCRWIDRKTSQRNTRVVRKVVIDGVEYIAADLADKSGHKTDVIIERVNRGLSLQEVLSTEKDKNLSGLSLGGAAFAAKMQALTHCKNGHEFTPANTKITPEGWRRCRRCHADRENERRRARQ